MNASKFQMAVSSYGKNAINSEVEYASPHRLIQMLMAGVLEKVAFAKGSIERGDIAGKGQNIGWAISIINGLRYSLDKQQGGEIADNLDRLYDYMIRRLSEANSLTDVACLDEVSRLMGEIKEGWDSIPEAYHQKSA